jgi:hypothetical protein
MMMAMCQGSKVTKNHTAFISLTVLPRCQSILDAAARRLYLIFGSNLVEPLFSAALHFSLLQLVSSLILLYRRVVKEKPVAVRIVARIAVSEKFDAFLMGLVPLDELELSAEALPEARVSLVCKCFEGCDEMNRWGCFANGAI